MSRAANRINSKLTRVAAAGATAAIAFAALEEFISPFVPLIITVICSLIAGSFVRLIFVRLLNKRLMSGYRYTAAKPQNQRAKEARNNDTAHQHINNESKINTPPDSLSLYRNLLGLRPRFTSEELKAAYRSCAAMYHPDRYAAAARKERENAEDLMKKVNEAYEALKTAAAG